MSAKHHKKQKKSKYDNFIRKLTAAISDQKKIYQILSNYDLEFPIDKINDTLTQLGINFRLVKSQKRFFLGHEIVEI